MDGITFWDFLKCMAEEGSCESCHAGSGNPGCEIRTCAQEKGTVMCALCECYPCEKVSALFKCCPMLKEDNALLKDKGLDAWAELRDRRKSDGYTYTENRKQ